MWRTLAIKQLQKLALLAFGLLAFAVTRSWGEDDPNQIVLIDFSPGLNTEESNQHIPDGAASKLLNVDVDDKTVRKREGSILVNSSTFTPSGTRAVDTFIQGGTVTWFVAIAGTQTYKSNSFGATWSVLSSTHGPTNSTGQLGYGSAFGKWWLTDNTTWWMNFDGNVVNFSTIPPLGVTFAFAYERMFTSTGAVLYASRISQPTDWTDDGLAEEDAFAQPVDPNDGEIIKALTVWRGRVFIFKPHSIHVVYFTDNVNPTFQTISKAYGSDHPYSIQPTGDGIIFLFNDGWYKYTDDGIIKLSDNINPTVKNILQLRGSLNSYVEDGNFIGTLTNTAQRISNYSVRLATFGRLDTFASDWSGGAFVNTTATASGQLIPAGTGTGTLVPDNSFELGSNTTTFATRVSSITAGIDAKDGEWMLLCDSLTINGLIPVTLSASYWSTSSGMFLPIVSTWTFVSFYTHTSPTYTREVSRSLQMNRFGASGPRFQITFPDTSLSILDVNKSFGFWYISVASGTGSEYNVFIDSASFYVTPDTATKSYTSPAYFTNISSGLPSFRYNSTTNLISTITYQLQGSTASNGIFHTMMTSAPYLFNENTMSNVSTGVVPSSFTFYRYAVTFSSYMFFGPALGPSSPLAKVNDFNMFAKAYQGIYKSTPITPGQSFSWGPISFNQNIPYFSFFGEQDRTWASTANVSFAAVYADTDSASGIDIGNTSSFTSSQTVTNGQIPTVATDATIYFVWFGSAPNSLQNPELLDYSASYIAANNTFVQSLFHKQRYYCAVSTASTSTTDTVFVLDDNQNWVIYNGWAVGDFMDYFDTPYYADGSIGRLYKFEQPNTYSDNGNAYQSFWESKRFDFGFPLQNKTQDKFGFYTERTPGTTLTLQYGIDGSSLTVKTADLGSKAGYYSEVVRPTNTLHKTGRTFSVRFDNSLADQFWRLLGFLLYPRLETSN